MTNLLLVFALIMFVLLVIIHELGHFITARRNGVEVEEFGLGFPPRLWSRHLKSGLRFSINALPLGGFVRLKGEHDSARAKGSFGVAPLKAKTKILLAGVAMNLLIAVGLFTITAWVGTPRLVDNQFYVAADSKIVRNEVRAGYVQPGSPAAKAGIRSNDIVTDIFPSYYCFSCAGAETSQEQDYHRISDEKDLRTTTKRYAGQKVIVKVSRDKKKQLISAKLLSNKEVNESKNTSDPKGYLGVTPSEILVRRATWSAPIEGVGLTMQFTKLSFQGLGGVFADLFRGQAGKAADSVAGPVRTFFVLKDSTTLGLPFVLMIVALISLTLAIMNTLPIPALDGGRLFLTLLFRALKKPLTQNIEDRVHGLGFIALIVLSIVITVREVAHL